MSTKVQLGDVFGYRDGSVWRVVAIKPLTFSCAISDKGAREEVRQPTPLTFARDYFYIHSDKREARS